MTMLHISQVMKYLNSAAWWVVRWWHFPSAHAAHRWKSLNAHRQGIPFWATTPFLSLCVSFPIVNRQISKGSVIAFPLRLSNFCTSHSHFRIVNRQKKRCDGVPYMKLMSMYQLNQKTEQNWAITIYAALLVYWYLNLGDSARECTTYVSFSIVFFCYYRQCKFVTWMINPTITKVLPWSE